MIWLTWRQFRAQFLVGVSALVVLTLYLLYLGNSIRSSYNSDILGCVVANGCRLADAKNRFVQDFNSSVQLAGVLLLAVPAIIGLFWGTPMITRELETNTHRLVWNQSVTRTRWLAAKLTLIGLFSVAVTGVLSLLLTWAASRFDRVQGNRFLAVAFASRNITPLSYAVFAFVLGIVVGLFVRKTVPAMALTLALVGLVQLVIPIVARPHLRTPVTETVAYTASGSGDNDGFLAIAQNGPVKIQGYSIPGALMIKSDGYLLDSSGNKVSTSQVQECLPGGGNPTKLRECVAKHNLHFEVSYQPANRYWPFQWLEFSGFLVLAALLSGLAFWQIRRVRG
jgi:ABC-type transport system involved in multi-copper enzyme maturation permease subunit